MIAPADFGYLCVLKASTQACRQLQPFQVVLAPKVQAAMVVHAKMIYKHQPTN